jgi:Na+-driven multidrug efflux pump
MGFFFGQGVGNNISRALGARRMEDAESLAATGFVSAFLIGILMAALGNVFLVPLARALGATPSLLPYTTDYLRYILMGAPFVISSLVLNLLLRFQGSAFFGMIGIASGAVLNIGLDFFFIRILGLGVKGAALATMISQALSCALLFGGCMRGENIRVRVRKFKPSLGAYREIIRGGSAQPLSPVFPGPGGDLLEPRRRQFWRGGDRRYLHCEPHHLDRRVGAPGAGAGIPAGVRL